LLAGVVQAAVCWRVELSVGQQIAVVAPRVGVAALRSSDLREIEPNYADRVNVAR